MPSADLLGRDVADILEGVDLSDPARRDAVVERIAASEKARQREVLAKATALGVPLRFVDENGRVHQLRDFRGEEPLYLTTFNRNAGISSAANLVALAPYSLNGAGLRVGVWDEGSVRSTHQELVGRITLRNSSAQLSDHATHVAGTVAASGVVPNAIGMAPQSLIDSYDWNNDTSEMTSAGAATATDAGKISLSNHSYGFNASAADMGRYESEARAVDSLAHGLPFYLIFWAAGNEQTDLPSLGGYQSITFTGLAKNVLTVGAVNDAVSGGVRSVAAATMSNFSSWGPCDDGRIKPDLVANGVSVYSATRGSDTSYDTYNGTSMATPSAMGSATLLVQLYQREFSGQRMRASLLKALLIHTADDLGVPGPDYKFGWGLINIKAAADVILQHKASLGSPKLIEDNLTNAQKTRTHTFTWDGASPIRATLAWTDPPGTAQSAADSRSPNLVHNLDLTITAPDGTTVTRPFVMPFVGTWTTASMGLAANRGKNNVDNVEQVLIASPTQVGTYTVTVSLDGSLTTSSQFYSLVLTGGTSSGGATRVLSLEGDLAFGNVAVGSTAQRSLTVRNFGTQALAVQSISLPSGFTASPTNFSVTPGGEQTVTVTFAPTVVQNFAGTLSVVSDATSGASSLSVSGSGFASASVQNLTNGVPVPNLAGSANSEIFFRISVPAGQQQLTISISGSSGDADLYVRQGSLPTVSLWDFRPYLSSSNESVTVSNPTAGEWFVMVRGYTEYSGVTLAASHQSNQTPTRILRISGNLDFGFIPVGGSASAQITLFNDGNANLSVTGIAVPTGFAVSPTSFVLAPGGSRVVTVTFSPTQVAVYSGVLTVQSDRTSGPNTLGITASGVDSASPLTNGVPTPPFNALPGSAFLFRITVPAGQSQLDVRTGGGTGDAGLYVRRGQAPTTSLFDFSSRSIGTAESISISNPTSGDYYVLVVGEPEFSAVWLSATFNTTVSKVIRLEGNLAFGNVRIGESAQRSLEIFNDGTSPLTITGATAPVGFSISGAAGVIQPRTSRTATVVFAPGAAGSFGGDISLQSDKTSGTETLACSGTGVATESETRLTNGVALSGLSGAQDSSRFFVISVPAETSSVQFSISGGTGDADLYVRRGARPTLSLYDHRPFLEGNNETVTISNPTPGEYFLMIDGYTAYTGVSLLASYTSTGPTRMISLTGDLAFGEVTIGSSATRTLTIANSGNSVLTVGSITYPSGFSGSWTGGTIAAGGSQQVQVTFAPSSSSSFGGTITVSSDRTSGNGQIACSGSGRPVSAPVMELDGDLHFGNLAVGLTSTRTLTISNTGNAALVVSTITFPAGFSGDWTNGTIAVGGSRDVTVTFSPTAMSSFAGNVVITSNTVGGTSQIACSGTGVATESETRLTNGLALTGLSGTQDSSRFFVISVPAGTSSVQFSISGGTGDADLYVRRGARPTLSLYDHRPFLEGNNETVTISNPSPGEYYLMIDGYTAYTGVSLVANYNGASPTRIISLTGDLAFGEVTMGSSATRTLTIANTGNSALTVGSIAYPVGFSGNWNGGTIAAGDSQQVQVTFAPASLGSFSGTLRVTSDSTSGNSQIACSGSGIWGGQVVGIEQGLPRAGLSGEFRSLQFFEFDVPAGASRLTVLTRGGTGNANLYLKRGSLPTSGNFDARSIGATNQETIQLNQPSAGRYYVLLYGENAFSSVLLQVSITSPALPTLPEDWRLGLSQKRFHGLVGTLHPAEANPATPLRRHGTMSLATVAQGQNIQASGSIQVGQDRYIIAPANLTLTSGGKITGLAFKGRHGGAESIGYELEFFPKAEEGAEGIFSGTLLFSDGSTLPVSLRAQMHSGRRGDTSPLSGFVYNTLVEQTSGPATGVGFLSVRVQANGDAIFSGRLPNNIPFLTRTSGVLLENGKPQWSAAVPLQSGKALWAFRVEAVAEDELFGESLWIVGNTPAATGSVTTARISGLRWMRPTTPLITPGDFALRIDPQGLTLLGAQEFLGHWGNNRPVLFPSPSGAKLSFAPNTGMFSGQVIPYGVARPCGFRGVLLPEEIISPEGVSYFGAGFLLHDGLSYPIYLQNAVPSP